MVMILTAALIVNTTMRVIKPPNILLPMVNLGFFIMLDICCANNLLVGPVRKRYCCKIKLY
jgi:hypothetical protein